MDTLCLHNNTSRHTTLTVNAILAIFHDLACYEGEVEVALHCISTEYYCAEQQSNLCRELQEPREVWGAALAASHFAVDAD